MLTNETLEMTVDNTMNSPNTSIESRSSNRGQNCAPIMICHIIRYKEDLHVWGMPVRIVTFVAIVEEIDAVSTKVNFHFRDETGTIKGVKWLSTEIRDSVPPVRKYSYARIYGHVRSLNNDLFVNVIAVEPIEHLNEILAHLMQVTLLCLEGKSSKEIAATQNKSITTAEIQDQNDNYSSGLSKEQSIIYDIIKCGKNEENGVYRDEIKSHTPAFLVHKVDEILNFLSNEGYIYTTITDEYFKTI